MCPWRQPGSGRNGPRAAPRTGTGEHVLAALCRSSPMSALDLARQVAIAAARDARPTYRHGLVAPPAGIATGMTHANLIALPPAWAETGKGVGQGKGWEERFEHGGGG